MRRVVLVLADGLRPDAITPSRMPSLDALGGEYTLALHATTVRPSTTVAALTSLATGLAPRTHGFTEPGLKFLSRLTQLRPVGRELARAGHRTTIVSHELSVVERSVVGALASAAGIGKLAGRGHGAREIAVAAHEALAAQQDGVVFVYMNDCDQAGHRAGWMSDDYLAAASEVDAGIGMLADAADDSLFIVMADHGGGGVTLRDHGEPHATNDHIPLVLAGPSVTRRHQLTRAVSLRPAAHVAVVVRRRHPGVVRRPGAGRGVRAGAGRGRGGSVTLRALTHLGGARVTIGASLGLLAVGEYRLGCATGLANALSHVVVHVLKRKIARPRPCDPFGRPLALVELPDPFSFPSGHAAATMAIAGTVTYAHPWVGVVLLPLAALVAYSRVALRVHHVGDVVAGAALGLAGAVAAALLL